MPDDFSPAAARALRVAAGLAARAGGRLVGLHVMSPFRAPDAGGLWLPETDALAARERRLAGRVGRAARAAGVPFSVRAEIGIPHACIVAAARAADVVVMATRGRGRAVRLLIGSVAERVVRHAPVPVLTIRGGAPRRVRRARRHGAVRPSRRASVRRGR